MTINTVNSRRQSSAVDHARCPALCTVRWLIGREAPSRGSMSVSWYLLRCGILMIGWVRTSNDITSVQKSGISGILKMDQCPTVQCSPAQTDILQLWKLHNYRKQVHNIISLCKVCNYAEIVTGTKTFTEVINRHNVQLQCNYTLLFANFTAQFIYGNVEKFQFVPAAVAMATVVTSQFAAAESWNDDVICTTNRK